MLYLREPAIYAAALTSQNCDLARDNRRPRRVAVVVRHARPIGLLCQLTVNLRTPTLQLAPLVLQSIALDRTFMLSLSPLFGRLSQQGKCEAHEGNDETGYEHDPRNNWSAQGRGNSTEHGNRKTCPRKPLPNR